jgi:dephospho-CoA kinase
MRLIGLTGGIASGKSLVASALAEAGARVIDADLVAREVVARGTPTWAAIVARFGRDVLQADGAIDRPRLARIVFGDAVARRELNALVHPQVAARMQQLVAAVAAEDPQAIVVLDIPLLYEAGLEAGLEAVIVVDAPEDLQLRRLMARDGLSRQEALARIQSQMPLTEKRARATLVIDNRGTPEDARAAARAVLERLRASAR